MRCDENIKGWNVYYDKIKDNCVWNDMMKE